MIQEIIVFVIAALVFGGIMYLYFEWQELRGKGVNAKLSNRLKELTEEEVLKDLEQGVTEWVEDDTRMNVIGQNGNEGLHYKEK